MKTKEITMIGLMTAITCIAGPLSLPLPFSPVPISLTNLAVYFSVYMIGMKRGTISYCVYLLLGLVVSQYFRLLQVVLQSFWGQQEGIWSDSFLWQSSPVGLLTDGMENHCQVLSEW